MTGLISGMDTEAMVKELVKANSTKLDKTKQEKQKLEWKQEAWQSLNTEIYNLYKGSLANLKTNSSFQTKSAKASDETKVSVKANSNSANGSHTVSVKQLASSAYLTGADIRTSNKSYTTYNDVNASTNFADMVDKNGNSLELAGKSVTFKTDDGKEATFTLGEDGVNNLADLNSKLQATEGFEKLSASFENGKLVFSNGSATTGEDGQVSGTKFTVESEGLGINGTVDFKKTEDGGEGLTLTKDLGAKVAGSFASADIKGGTKLSDIGVAVGTTFTVKDKTFVVDDSTTLKDLASGLSKLGVNANFDESRGRFYVNSSDTGEANDFNIDVAGSDKTALDILGLSQTSGAKKVDAQDAIIEYNGVEYNGASNTFDINGLSITAKSVTGKYDKASGTFTDDAPINISVSSDTEGMYNTIKKFVKDYNALIDKMNSLYNEDSEGYDPLTDDEKNQMSAEQIEKWEEKAKKGLLRRDSTISTLTSKMRSILNQGIEVTDKNGNTQKVTLASLGIVTGDYTERGKLHIMGDEDDETYSGQENKLKAALENNPEIFSQAFAGNKDNQGIGFKLYDYLNTAMKRSSTSSSLTFYNDITLKNEIKGKDDEVDKWEEKLQKMEDKYYDQFSAMETALAKLQEQQSYISQLMGM